MRLIFAGTPEFAACALSALLNAGHTIPLVLTQPDRPSGRGLKQKHSPVKAVALAHGIAVAQPESLREANSLRPIREVVPEVMVVAAYGLILPQAALDIPQLGCINIHASLLPRWRGAAPIQRAIEAGDAETGITLMQMDAGLDTGAILSRHPLPIGPEDSAGSLHDKLAALGASAIVDLLPRLDGIVARPQEAASATYAAKIHKEEARLDWSLAAAQLERRVRAFNPFPGAYAFVEGAPLKIWRARAVPGQGAPGEVLSTSPSGIRIACGSGALDLLEVQKAGGRRLEPAAFLAGHAITPGLRLT
jgi:methionyl-tRNA formyltransferase